MGRRELDCSDELRLLIRQNHESFQRIARMLREIEERASLKGFPLKDEELHSDTGETRPSASSQVKLS